MESPLSSPIEGADEIRTIPLEHCDPKIISQIINIDLMTFSEPTWSRSTAGLMIRHGRTFLLIQGALVIGTCQCVRAWDRPREVVLFMMALRPGYRHQGIGSRFLEGVIDHLREAGCRSVVLDIKQNNKAAIRLYEEKFGFRKTGFYKDLYRQGEDMVQMRLALQADDLVPVVFPG